MRILPLIILLTLISATPVMAGKVSWYGQEYCRKYSPKCITASGEKFDDTQMTAACAKQWKLGTRLKVSLGNNSVVVRCNDRGSFSKYGRSLDLSKGAFARLAPLSRGVLNVTIIQASDYE